MSQNYMISVNLKHVYTQNDCAKWSKKSTVTKFFIKKTQVIMSQRKFLRSQKCMSCDLSFSWAVYSLLRQRFLSRSPWLRPLGFQGASYSLCITCSWYFFIFIFSMPTRSKRAELTVISCYNCQRICFAKTLKCAMVFLGEDSCGN